MGSSCIEIVVLGVLNKSSSSGKSSSCEDREDDEEHENVAHGGVGSGWKMACELNQSHCTAALSQIDANRDRPRQDHFDSTRYPYQRHNQHDPTHNGTHQYHVRHHVHYACLDLRVQQLRQDARLLRLNQCCSPASHLNRGLTFQGLIMCTHRFGNCIWLDWLISWFPRCQAVP